MIKRPILIIIFLLMVLFIKQANGINDKCVVQICPFSHPMLEDEVKNPGAGTGIIINIEYNILYILTSAHVMRFLKCAHITFLDNYTIQTPAVVDYSQTNYDKLFNYLEILDPDTRESFIEKEKEIINQSDIAVLRLQFPGNAEFDIHRLQLASLLKGELPGINRNVTVVGYSHGNNTRKTIKTNIKKIEKGQIYLDGSGITDGFSGAPVFYKNSIIGIIHSVEDGFAVAYPASIIYEILKRYNACYVPEEKNIYIKASGMADISDLNNAHPGGTIEVGIKTGLFSFFLGTGYEIALIPVQNAEGSLTIKDTSTWCLDSSIVMYPQITSFVSFSLGLSIKTDILQDINFLYSLLSAGIKVDMNPHKMLPFFIEAGIQTDFMHFVQITENTMGSDTAEWSMRWGFSKVIPVISIGITF